MPDTAHAPSPHQAVGPPPPPSTAPLLDPVARYVEHGGDVDAAVARALAPRPSLDLDALYPAEGPVVRMAGRTFRFRPVIGARSLARVQDAVEHASTEGEIASIAALEAFVANALDGEVERHAWAQVIEADTLPTWAILEVFRHLVEFYGQRDGARPTAAPGDSSSGSASSGTASTAASSPVGAPTSPPFPPTSPGS